MFHQGVHPNSFTVIKAYCTSFQALLILLWLPWANPAFEVKPYYYYSNGDCYRGFVRMAGVWHATVEDSLVRKMHPLGEKSFGFASASFRYSDLASISSKSIQCRRFAAHWLIESQIHLFCCYRAMEFHRVKGWTVARLANNDFSRKLLTRFLVKFSWNWRLGMKCACGWIMYRLFFAGVCRLTGTCLVLNA